MKAIDLIKEILDRPHTEDELRAAFAALDAEAVDIKSKANETLEQYKQEERAMHEKFMATFQ